MDLFVPAGTRARARSSSSTAATGERCPRTIIRTSRAPMLEHGHRVRGDRLRSRAARSRWRRSSTECRRALHGSRAKVLRHGVECGQRRGGRALGRRASRGRARSHRLDRRWGRRGRRWRARCRCRACTISHRCCSSRSTPTSGSTPRKRRPCRPRSCRRARGCRCWSPAAAPRRASSSASRRLMWDAWPDHRRPAEGPLYLPRQEPLRRGARARGARTARSPAPRSRCSDAAPGERVRHFAPAYN